MRILGADSLKGQDTSIDAIPVNYLQPFDMCVVMTQAEPDTVMFYEYDPMHGGDEDLPYVVNPVDNTDVNLQTGLIVGTSRWVLKNIYARRITADELSTNTITPEISGAPITIGDSIEIDDFGIAVDGQVTINVHPLSGGLPPLVVESDVMVENLNAEYVGGTSLDGIMQNTSFEIDIPEGVEDIDIYPPVYIPNAPDYMIITAISNIHDPSPSIYGVTTTVKADDHFTLRFSGIIDSPNYTLRYIIVGEVEPII